MNRPPEPEIDLNKILGSIFGGKKGNKKSNPGRLLFREITGFFIKQASIVKVDPKVTTLSDLFINS